MTPTYYLLRGAGRERGPMDADSARLVLSELGTGDLEIAEVRPGATAGPFVPAAGHALASPPPPHEPSPEPPRAPLWLTTETSGWPEAARLGVVSADAEVPCGPGTPVSLEAPRGELLAELERLARALGADAVVAVAFGTTAISPDALLLSATGTALRL